MSRKVSLNRFWAIEALQIFGGIDMFSGLLQKGIYSLQKIPRSIYYSMPDVCRMGRTFSEKYRFLEETQYWEKNRLEELQMWKLKHLLVHAYESVPYYRNLFDSVGFSPYGMKDFSELEKIPFLTKEIVRSNLDDLISRRYKRRSLTYMKTGGSTGQPMGFYVDRKWDRQIEWAFVSHMWSRVGYDIRKSHRTVYLRGDVPYSGVFEYKNGGLVFSSYNLTDETMDKYLVLLEEYNPDFIRAYPSSLSLLANYVNRQNITVDVPNLRAVICASENIYPFQREALNKAFGVRVYSFYGHSEHACIGGECETNVFYHLQSEYGYTELIADDGCHVNLEDQIGEVVATGFTNYAMPFIRYKTEDLAVNTNEECSCGRHYKLIKRIEGRAQEYVVTREGNASILTGFYSIFDEIKSVIDAGQFYQDQIGVLQVRIVKKEGYLDKHSDYVVEKLKRRYGDSLDIELVFVPEIERTENGKYRFMVQKLPI